MGDSVSPAPEPVNLQIAGSGRVSESDQSSNRLTESGWDKFIKTLTQPAGASKHEEQAKAFSEYGSGGTLSPQLQTS